MSTDNAVPAVTAAPSASKLALGSWILFDWAAQPFYTLVLTFLFAPYFANAVAADPVAGQSLWGYATAVAGILVALLSPLLGSVADRSGRQKPWIALFSILLAAGMAGLWLAAPKASFVLQLFVLLLFVIAMLGAEFTTVFTNAMMPRLVGVERLGRLSGLGFAVGYLGGLVSLIIMAGFIVTAPGSGKTLIGLEPLLALDDAARETDRLVGPFSALWYLVFVLPLFLFVPDGTPTRPNATKRSALDDLLATLRELPGQRDMMLFLIARMLYIDGLGAIFAFGGIYGASVFGWGPLELGLFGIALTITGFIGALIGGHFDDRHGAKIVILVALVLLMASSLTILSVDKNHILFFLSVPPKVSGSGPFTSSGEQVFLAAALVVGLVAAPIQSSSRTLMARLAPPEKMTQYFGLFAFSGKVTAFLAPFLVAVFTGLFDSQRIGMAAIGIFLVGGFLLMLQVRTRYAGMSM